MTENNSSDSIDETKALDPFEVALDALRQGKYRESLGGKTGVNPTGASAWMINERGEKRFKMAKIERCVRKSCVMTSRFDPTVVEIRENDGVPYLDGGNRSAGYRDLDASRA